MEKITDNTIQSFLQTPHKNAYFLKFGADWCGQCKTLELQLEDVDTQMPTIAFGTVDCDDADSQLLLHDYDIRNLPTCILFDADGKIIKRYNNMSGFNIKNDLLNYK